MCLPLQVSALRTLDHNNIVKFRDWCAAPLSLLTPPWRINCRCRRLLLHAVHTVHGAVCIETLKPQTCRYESARSYWLVLEFCVGGCLADVLRADRRLPEAVVRNFGLGLAASLQYCHSQVPEHRCSTATPRCRIKGNQRNAERRRRRGVRRCQEP